MASRSLRRWNRANGGCPQIGTIKTHSTQNNALAGLYDLAPEEQREGIMRRLLFRDLNCQPYFMHFVFVALNRAGLFDEFGTAQIRRWTIENDTQSFREMWGNGDYSHAWECTPLFQMSGVILGITPLSPGFHTVSIAPRTCDLAWAKGVVPTPDGRIEVSWTRSNTRFDLKANLPLGSPEELQIPIPLEARKFDGGRQTHCPGELFKDRDNTRERWRA